MPERNKKQIETEIKALQACKSYVPHFTVFGDDNHAKLDLQIEYLRGEIDIDANEWHDYTDDEQSSILEAECWKAGESDESPSSGWDSFKPKVKVINRSRRRRR